MSVIDKSFQEKIDFVKSYDIQELEDNMFIQADILDSRAFNRTMNMVEKELNSLYEKIRTLEEISAYTKTFIENKIHVYKKELNEKMKNIEAARDRLKEKTYVIQPVSFINDVSVMYDRNGEPLESVSVVSDAITVSSQEMYSPKIKSVSKTQNEKEYSSNLNDIKEGKKYITSYVLDKPNSNGVKEELTIMFDKPETINHINFSTINCDVEIVSVICENGTEAVLTDVDNKFFSNIKASGVKVRVSSKNYRSRTFSFTVYEHESVTSNMIDSEIRRSFNPNSDIAGFEKETLSLHLQDAYKDRLKAIEEQMQSFEYENNLEKLIVDNRGED